MKRIIALVSEDMGYSIRLQDYLNTKEDFDFRTVYFSDAKSFDMYCETNRVDVLLSEDDFIENGMLNNSGIKHVYVLSDFSRVHEGPGHKAIYKFQSGRAIAEAIKKFYLEEGGSLGSSASRGKKRLVAVCAPEGGCFKTTFAVAYALRNAESMKTLFLSFDPFQTLSFDEKADSDQGLSDIVYFMAVAESNLPAKIRDVVRHSGKLDYILGVAHWYDVFDFNHERMRRFVETLITGLDYECIVIDVGNLDVSSMEILFAADTVYVPGQKSRTGDAKYEEWCRQLKFISGDSVLEKVAKIHVPFDEALSQGSFAAGQLLAGKIGAFVKECMDNEKCGGAAA